MSRWAARATIDADPSFGPGEERWPSWWALTKSEPPLSSYVSGAWEVGAPDSRAAEIATGMQMVHVPYKGGAPAAMATAGGEVEMTVVSVSSAAGRSRPRSSNALAVTGPARIAALPEIPTMAESGIADYQVIDYIGWLRPPNAGVDDQSGQCRAREILQMEDVKAKFLEQGIEAKGSTPEEYRSIARKEGERWGRVVKDANNRPISRGSLKQAGHAHCYITA